MTIIKPRASMRGSDLVHMTDQEKCDSIEKFAMTVEHATQVNELTCLCGAHLRFDEEGGGARLSNDLPHTWRGRAAAIKAGTCPTCETRHWRRLR